MNRLLAGSARMQHVVAPHLKGSGLRCELLDDHRPSAFRYTRYLFPSLHDAAKSFSACTFTSTISPHGNP